MGTIETARLIVRPPIEPDRARFVELFTSESFTVHSGGVHDIDSANARFDHMLCMIDAVPYAKQPVIERGSGAIIGYTGADSVALDGVDRLEWGWRLAPEARGRGYATEAAAGLLALADRIADGEMLCLVNPENHASRRVAEKVGFRWWQRIDWMGDPSDPTDLLVRAVGSGGPPLVAAGFGDDVTVRIHDAVAFARWHLGQVAWADALRSGAITVEGPRDLRRALPTWNRAPEANASGGAP